MLEQQYRTPDGRDHRVDEAGLKQLAVAYQQGNQGSFRILLESMTRPLIAMAYRYTQDWEWARDLTQETWVRVHERIHQYDPARSFRAWLLVIHRNRCLDHLRKAWVQRESTPSEEEMGELRLIQSREDPEEDLERRQFHARLMRAVSELSEIQRQVYTRVDLEQNDQKEVARALGIKYATLRTTLYHARRRLAGILRGMEGSS